MPTFRKLIGVSAIAAIAVASVNSAASAQPGSETDRPSATAIETTEDAMRNDAAPSVLQEIKPSELNLSEGQGELPTASSRLDWVQQSPTSLEIETTVSETELSETEIADTSSTVSETEIADAPPAVSESELSEAQLAATENTLQTLLDDHSEELAETDIVWLTRLQHALAANPTTAPLPKQLISPHIAQTTIEDIAPVYLDPSPNPLLFPTDPAEVRIEGTQPLTLEQAIDLARRNNVDLQRTKVELERSQTQLREALATRLPSITFQSQLQRSQSASSEITARSGTQTINGDSPQTSLSGTVEIRYDLITSGLRSANIRAAEKQVKISTLQVEVIEEQIRLNVAEQYYNLQQSKEQLRIRQQALVQAERSLKDAQALERAGVGTRFAVLQAQVQVANEQQRLTEAIASLRTARRTLAQIMNMPQTIDVSAADPVEIVGRWQLPLDDSIVLAYKNRAELEQRLNERDLNEFQRTAILAGLKPQVSLFANYNVLELTFDEPLVPQGAGDGYSLGAQLNWTLYDGGRLRAQAEREEADVAIAEQQFTSDRNQIRLDVENAYFQLVSSFDNIQTSIVGLAQAQEALRLARLRFQAGVGTQTDVINSETDLTQAQFNQVQAILGYNIAVARLQRAISNVSNAAR
ncbi:TolC family protein [Roseofilum casamattae]|uniref:TolC family protein n=1 Tax=Roseofilum casamattae BLCC-M143 TaxID=3022442 RepID=A0ABT7C1S2_9CYAN|nr:TolC family protein [Roseofilum casamattae]MDJ1185017.1 TolC family protein [Roseofilum casamattae BLCC-M143]